MRKWEHCVGHTHLGPESALGRPRLGAWCEVACSVLQISYGYLIIALGIQLDYEKVRFASPAPAS